MGCNEAGGGVWRGRGRFMLQSARKESAMGRSRYRFGDLGHPHFLTCTAANWIPVFARTDAADIVIASLRYLAENGTKIYAWTLLENHLHFIAQHARLDTKTAAFKSYTGKQLLALLRARGGDDLLREFASPDAAGGFAFWREGSHPVCIEGAEMMKAKTEYVHNNPVRRGYVDHPADWRYSSARDYEGKAGLVPVCIDW